MTDFLSSYGYSFLLGLIIAGMITGAVFSRHGGLKMILYNLAGIVFALLIYEFYLRMTDPKPDGRSYNTGTYAREGYFAGDPDLGYRPADSGIYTSSKFTADGEPIYNVTYTFRNGTRYTPNSNDTSRRSVIFFGCSVTFGEGVEDSCNLPFYLNAAFPTPLRVVNFGFHGYGPHHMLAIAAGHLPGYLKRPASTGAIAFYSFIPDHIRRCAGYSKWDANGPRYELEGGELVRKGNFTAAQKGVPKSFFSRIWMGSYTYRSNFSPESRSATHEDVRRAVAVILATDGICQAEGIDFRIIVWDHRKKPERIDTRELDFFYSEIRKSGIPVYFVHDTVSPDQYESENRKFAIANDGHPTPVFYQTVAQYVYNQINKK